MGSLGNRENGNCERFRDALDILPTVCEARRSAEEWRAELPEAEARHWDACENCRAALEEFAETRSALAGIALAEPGPWFAARVMAAIGVREREEAAKDGVWLNVRRLAPRMVALSALLLVLGGSWTVQQKSREKASSGVTSGDIVFDSGAMPTWYDDGLGTATEVRP